MAFFTFEWPELVTDPLLTQIEDASAEPLGSHRAEAARLIALILRNTGGMPVIDAPAAPTADERSSMARRLLLEALGHYQKVAGMARTGLGHYILPTPGAASDGRIESLPMVDVNRANAAALAALPAVGQTLASAIVRDREDRGYFASLDELADRIDRIGPAAVKALKHATSFHRPLGAPASELVNEQRLSSVLSACLARFPDAAAGSRLVAFLQALTSLTSRTPHPDSVKMRPRTLKGSGGEAATDADFVGLLEGADYHARVPALLRAAATTIRVAMFHAALGGPEHPTKTLLDELIAASARGVDVKVVLDRDRDTDPYMSTVINAAAKRYLEEHGVPCRYDNEALLLHSKYLVIDGTRAVIGSHNWSAGSYFEFDDLSFVVDSIDVASALSARFDQLWT